MNRNLGILALRLAFGFQLVKVSYENVIHPAANMPQFVAYLQSLGFPFPTPGAYVSAYTEFIGGILWLLGFQTRLASAFVLINFSVALGMAHLHINDSYQNTMPSLNLVAVSLFLLLNGPGRYSIDEQFSRMR
ncbi:DoxX family protein [Fibrella sp. HMF5335]|uniref:DoxX family protein n=1 Tax=Fibrella rubiginis TaxID=2817060 RepID=A0A939GFG9_9BACT|nr:DoxX family protein [Fibrella rubiginis]MBO0937366.1 DoxX family protein [Fibrella rubiginis]